ncbi:hypothetical protein N7532_010020 [Penicillium argentinense]|uniref:Uncharacterized protein n=1 Tax=Penicillium argentinense TaxID=1131581 RepID=A0A9W9EP10_9EURO|nr:uncharacterized protein N7532_010020 [Penicillium argentinense]KAJ5085249.1 hypothetical protein N7532_010020 [Penicillium argentinense]
MRNIDGTIACIFLLAWQDFIDSKESWKCHLEALNAIVRAKNAPYGANSLEKEFEMTYAAYVVSCFPPNLILLTRLDFKFSAQHS